MTRNDVNIDNVVRRKVHSTLPENTNYTNSVLFALPMIGLTTDALGLHFVNCFIKDTQYETTLERPLFLLFNCEYKTKTEEKYYQHLHNELTAKEEFVTFYYTGNINDRKYIIYLFNVNNEFTDDYDKYLQGKYSQFSPLLKKRFPKYRINKSTGRKEETVIGKVVNKSPELKKYWEERLGVTLEENAEVWSRPYLNEIETI